MRIRKQYQVIPTNAKLENRHSTSDKNGYTCEYLNGALDYSETETICGYDDNGKPIYRRVVAGTFPEANTAGNQKYYTNLAEITNLKDLYRYDATFGDRAPFSSNFYGGAYYIVSYLENNKVIIVTTLAIQTTYKYRITLEYTKTTDD